MSVIHADRENTTTRSPLQPVSKIVLPTDRTRMELTTALTELRKAARQGKYIYTGPDLQMLMPKDSHQGVVETTCKLAEAAILTRACKGVYVYRDGQPEDRSVLYDIATMIRRGSYIYVSLEKALSAHGIISQIPLRLTLMTTGRQGNYRTPWGDIEFTHTDRSPLEIFERSISQPSLPLRLAQPDLALEDLKHVQRNLHPVEMEDYREAMRDVGESKV
jgi:hypothetical protein